MQLVGSSMQEDGTAMLSRVKVSDLRGEDCLV